VFGTIYYKVLKLQRPTQPFIAEAWVQFETLVYELWWLGWYWDEVFSEHFDLRLSIILSLRHTLQYNFTN